MSRLQPNFPGGTGNEPTAIKRLGPMCARILLAALCLFSCAPAQTMPSPASPSSLDSPVGQWRTVDDVTGKVKSIVQIREQNGVLYGTVEEVFSPPVPHPLCIHCPGQFRNRPVVGLQILWGLHKDGAEWTGGQILDPETGKIYRCNLSFQNGDRTLRVRGYIGFSLFGRTEHWLRVAAP